MYKDILQSIDHIQIWPVMSFVIFFAFFLGLIWWIFTVDRDYISSMKNMPLNEDKTQSETSQPKTQSQPS